MTEVAGSPATLSVMPRNLLLSWPAGFLMNRDENLPILQYHCRLVWNSSTVTMLVQLPLPVDSPGCQI